MATSEVMGSGQAQEPILRRSSTLHVVLLIGMGLLLSWPLLTYGAPDLSHDAVYHALWAKQFGIQFWRGDLYPRWFTNVNGGYGGPSGFFYPPWASFVSALFWPLLEARDPNGWLVAGYGLALGEILSGITAYWWLRRLAKPQAALLGATVYLLAPYHLAMDVYLRGASAEFWVFVWFPLVLWSADGLMRHSRWAVALAALGYALAVLSHPTLALCFAPIPVAYVFFFSESQECFRNTVTTAAALLLGVGLSAVYLLPAMVDQDKAYVVLQTIGHFDYRKQWLWQDNHELATVGRYFYGRLAGTAHHVSWETGLKIPFLVVTPLSFIAIAALFLVVVRKEQAARTRRVAIFYGVVTVISLFLMTSSSALFWRMAPFLKFLQFPFRMNAMLVISAAALAALAAPHLWPMRARMVTVFLLAVALSWLGLDGFYAARGFSAWGTNLLGKQADVRQIVRTQMDFPSMWPRPANLALASNFRAFDRFVAAYPPKAAELETPFIGNMVGEVRVESWEPRRVTLQVDAPYDCQLTLNHFYYRGWQVRIVGAPGILAAQPSANGLMQFDVPRGSYRLVVELPHDEAERLGIAISLFSLALLGAAAIWAGMGSPPAAARRAN